MKPRFAIDWILFQGSLCAPLALGLVACGESKEDGSVQKLGDVAASAQVVGVAQACGQCHVFPPTDALPSTEWTTVIDQMVQIASDSKTPLHPDDIADARSFYSENSPRALVSKSESEETVLDSQLWHVTHFTPPGLEETLLPAVAHVAIERLAEGEPLSLLVAEMRSRSLLHLPLGTDSAESPVLYPMLRELNYPARVKRIDLDGDSLTDLVISGLGSMQPDNDAKGTIFAVQQQSGRRFHRQSIASGLGRPADVCAADFDGDGDEDIAVAAFGLRDPGQLAVLENQSKPGAKKFKFEVHQLDSRDGFTSLSAADIDGDGAVDIVALVAQEHEQVIVFRNEGKLSFSQHVIWAAPHPSWAFSHLLVADINGDARPDIVTTNGDSLDFNVAKPYSGVQAFLNRGHLDYQHELIGALPGASSSACADIDDDGDLDIVSTAFMPLSTPREWIAQKLASIVWFENTGDSSNAEPQWVKHVVERYSASHPTVAVADCDGDGLKDIVVGNYVWIDKQRGPLHRSPYVSIYSQMGASLEDAATGVADPP